MTSLRRRCVLALGLLSVCGASLAQPADATLFHNVRIYDGRSASLSAPSDVLVRGSKQVGSILIGRMKVAGQ